MIEITVLKTVVMVFGVIVALLMAGGMFAPSKPKHKKAENTMKSQLEQAVIMACEEAKDPRVLGLIKRLEAKKLELETKHAKEMYDAMEVIYADYVMQCE